MQLDPKRWGSRTCAATLSVELHDLMRRSRKVQQGGALLRGDGRGVRLVAEWGGEGGGRRGLRVWGGTGRGSVERGGRGEGRGSGAAWMGRAACGDGARSEEQHSGPARWMEEDSQRGQHVSGIL